MLINTDEGHNHNAGDGSGSACAGAAAGIMWSGTCLFRVVPWLCLVHPSTVG